QSAAGKGREQHSGRQVDGERDHLEIAEGQARRFRRLSYFERAEITASPARIVLSSASRRSTASAAPSRPERISPTSSAPAMMAVPGAGKGPDTLTGVSCFLTSARYFMRAVSSWPI